MVLVGGVTGRSGEGTGRGSRGGFDVGGFEGGRSE